VSLPRTVKVFLPLIIWAGMGILAVWCQRFDDSVGCKYEIERFMVSLKNLQFVVEEVQRE
jgi:hypothetical protein